MKRLEPLRPWTPPEDLSERTQGKLYVEVPLVPEPGAPESPPRVVLANFDELKRLGVKVPRGNRLTKSFERELLERFALSPSPPAGERVGQRGDTLVRAVATRYQGYPGAVQGDGRAAFLAQATRHDAQGRPRERVDVQLKGIATGLLPRRKDWASRHGKMFLARAIQEALYADYLASNGVSSNRWLCIIDSGTTIVRPADNENIRVGLHVRTGHFWRMGHLWHFGDDPRSLGEVVRHVASLLAVERGRSTPHSLPRLFRTLLRRKVLELADSYWLRYAHGSFTPDNIGLFECIDQGTACTVDRTHVSFSAHRMGYGHCPDILMEEDYKRHLPDLLKRAATRAERNALNALPLAPLARGWLEVRMTFQALRHLGLDEVQVRTLLGRHRAKAIAFWRFVKQLADEVVRDHEVAVGSQMTFRARHAARYDLFAALTKVVQLLTGPTRTARQRALRLLPVLRPESDQIGLDLARALTLVEHVDALTALAEPEEIRRREEAVLWLERAKALNRRIRSLEGGDSFHLSELAVKARVEGASPARLRARLSSIMRANVVDGEGTAIHAARRLRQGRAPKLADGRVLVTETVEGGVRIQQVSDGAHHALRFVVAGNPLHLEQRQSLRLELRQGRVRLEREPTEVTAHDVVFEVPVHAESPLRFRATFSADAETNRRITNGGVGFGRGMTLLFRSLDVRVALETNLASVG